MDACLAHGDRPRKPHSHDRLADGRVLVVGGTSAKGGATNEVEIYDPVTDAWTRADPIKNPRYNHTATILADGRVLVAGGFTPGAFHTATKKAEVYDPAADRWTVVSSMLEPRAVHAAVLLADGRVLVAGGVTSPPNVLTVTERTEIWNPARGVDDDRVLGCRGARSRPSDSQMAASSWRAASTPAPSPRPANGTTRPQAHGQRPPRSRRPGLRCWSSSSTGASWPSPR